MKKGLLSLALLLIILLTACNSNSIGIKDDPAPAKISPEEINKDELLSAKVIKLLDSEEYTMEYKRISNSDPDFVENEENTSWATTVVSGNETATIYHTEDGDKRTVLKDDVLYTIDDKKKTITTSPIDESQVLKHATGEGDPDIIEKGEERFMDKLQSFEAFEYENRKTKFYFDGTHLIGWEVMKNNHTTVIEIKSLSDKVDPSVFELPTDYTKNELENE